MEVEWLEDDIVEQSSGLYKATNPKARKEHICSLCKRIIVPGEYYTRISDMFMGDFITNKQCTDCCPMINQQ